MTRSIQSACFSLVAAILVASIGCGAQATSPQTLELDLDSNDIRTILVDPLSFEHAVSIVASSDGPPLKVFIYLSEDEAAVDRAITLGQACDKIISSQSDSPSISLAAKIPADKEVSLRLQTASPENAKAVLTISN